MTKDVFTFVFVFRKEVTPCFLIFPSRTRLTHPCVALGSMKNSELVLRGLTVTGARKRRTENVPNSALTSVHNPSVVNWPFLLALFSFSL